MTESVKLYIRGTISNGIGAALLCGIGYGLDVGPYCAVAVGLQALVYLLHGLPFRSEKFYDLSGSATHLSLVLASCLVERVRSPRQMIVAFCSVIWLVRLGNFLFLRISRDGKDGRFDHIRPNWFAFLGAWTLQACWVTLVQLPVVLLNARDDAAPLGALDAIGAALWVCGFLLEAIADNQKMTFRADPDNKHKFITTGVWAYSRHPNYFGEITMWVALSLLATSAALCTKDWRLLGAWGSPAFTALLLLKVSGVPMVEKAGLEKWGSDPAYMHYVLNTSLLVPWFPAGPSAPADPQKVTLVEASSV